MPIEFTNNKKIKNTLLGITLSKNKDEISKITYFNGSCYKTSNIYPEDLIKIYNIKSITPDVLIKAFELLCQFNPQKCYDLYCLIQNKELKDLLILAIRNVYNKYSIFFKKNNNTIDYTQNLFKGNYPRNYYDFYINLNTWFAKILLNNNKDLENGFYQKIAVNNVPIKCSGRKEFLNPTLDNIIFLSNLICEGDIEEYQKLLDTINHNNKYYKAIIQGGNLYTNKIKSLERVITKK